MKIQDLDTPAVCAGAVTASTIAIQPPANLQNYSPGTNGHHEPEKTRTAAYCRMLVERWAAFDPALKEYDVRLFLVMLTLLQPDGLMIAGEPKLCRLTGKKSPRTPRQALERLCKAGYLTCVRKGNGKGNASHYVRGEMFNPERAEELQARIRQLTQRGSKNTPFEGERVQFFGSKGGQKMPPQPIDQPRYTHTKESDSALNEETWKAECLRLNPERDPADITRTLDLAISQGAKDGFWKHLCRKFHSHYKAPPKPSAAKVAQKAFTQPTRPPVKSSCDSPRIGGSAFDGLPPEEWHAKDKGWYGLGGRENWIKAGRPHLVLHPEKDRIVSELIARYCLKAGESNPAPVHTINIHGLLNGLVGDSSGHTKPSREQFILEAKRLGLSAQDGDSIYRQLEGNKWLMKDGTPIKNWKGYLNGCAKKERKTQ